MNSDKVCILHVGFMKFATPRVRRSFSTNAYVGVEALNLIFGSERYLQSFRYHESVRRSSGIQDAWNLKDYSSRRD